MCEAADAVERVGVKSQELKFSSLTSAGNFEQTFVCLFTSLKIKTENLVET